MRFGRCINVLVCATVVIFVRTVGGAGQCSQGEVCFPSGVVPSDVTANDDDYHCCLDKNTRRRHYDQDDGSRTCVCEDYFTAEQDMKEWADSSNNEGRMCNRGEAECAGLNKMSLFERKFTFCCKTSPSQGSGDMSFRAVDADKEEYSGCRCPSLPVPTPNPSAQVVPRTESHTSTGESCFYDDGCQAYPALKCQSPRVTFCCYGSRGMATANDRTGLYTRCTCTNDFHGERCENYPIPINQEDTIKTCLLDCDDKPDEDKCVNVYNHARCCPDGYSVVATQHKGSFMSCSCHRNAQRNCDADASGTASRHVGGHLGDVIIMAGTVTVAAWMLIQQIGPR